MNIIKEEDRLDFLPAQFKNHFVYFENLVYMLSNDLIVDYKGAYWEFATKGTEEYGEAAFMFLKDDKVSVRNIFTKEPFEIDGTLAGLVITSYAIEFLYNKTYDEFLIDKLDALKTVAGNYARENGFSRQYFGLTD